MQRNAMNKTKDNDVLSEIIQKYKTKKKQLEKYDKFIDRNQRLVVGGPFILCLINILIIAIIIVDRTSSEHLNNNVNVKIVGFISLTLFIITVMLAFITSSRNSTKASLEKQLTSLKDKAIVLQRHTKNHNNITTDELGLWYDIKQDNDINHSPKTTTISAIVTTLVLVFVFLFIAQGINHGNIDTQTKLQQDNQIQASQDQCLNDAYTSYEKSWKSADKDGDGNISFRDGATDIKTAYYDSVIACYRTYKTVDSENYIADYQTKRQQEVDKYTAWLESSKQSTYVQTPTNSYSSGVSCTSSSIGSSTYTHCY